jgi:serine/threonine protein kinase
MPRLVPVGEVNISGRVGIQMCWDLIKGVAYLHDLYIAHGDLKLGNLVVDHDNRLKIIDFGLAIQVENENTKVIDYCGTVGYMAPEIEKKQKYSPIKADRWSLGKAILDLLKNSGAEDKLLTQKAKELMEIDPQLRPSVCEWREWMDEQT